MSREFETPIGTIKRRLHVARHRLKGLLEGVDADIDVDNDPKPLRKSPRSLSPA